MAQVVGRVKDELSVEAAVYHDSDAFYRQRRLSDRRSQYHLSLPLCGWADSFVLLLRRQIAVELTHMGSTQTGAKQFRASDNVGLSGQKRQYIALLLTMCPTNNCGNCRSNLTRRNIFFGEHRLHGIHPALTGDFASAECLTDGCGIYGGRHHDDIKVGSEYVSRLLCQTESQIRLQVALMKLIEDHTAHTFERRVIGHATRKDSLCDHLYPCLRRDLLLETYLIAHRLPHFLAEHLSHAQSHLSGSEATGLKHDYSTLNATAEHRQWQ